MGSNAPCDLGSVFLGAGSTSPWLLTRVRNGGSGVDLSNCDSAVGATVGVHYVIPWIVFISQKGVGGTLALCSQSKRKAIKGGRGCTLLTSIAAVLLHSTARCSDLRETRQDFAGGGRLRPWNSAPPETAPLPG